MRVRLPSALLVCSFAALTACDTAFRSTEPSVAAGRAAPQPSIPVVSPESRALRAHYAQVQSALLTQGMLRIDGGGPDAPYTDEMLGRNFKKIALYEEYASVGGNIVARETASKLHRWSTPVRVGVEFDAEILQDKRLSDRRAIETYVARLARVTRHTMTVGGGKTNFHVFIVDEAARRELGPKLEEIIPSITPAAVKAVTEMPRSSYCLVFAWDPEDDGTYEKAVAVIRAEHPDLMRLSCIHEEIAQGLGLSNDSPNARPSVFNDDEEFGLLTRHDEELLELLYDPRLRPGMSADEAMPIVRRILNERASDAG